MERTIALNIDGVPLQKKPEDEKAGYIKARFNNPETIKQYTVSQIFGAIENGYSFTPRCISKWK